MDLVAEVSSLKLSLEEKSQSQEKTPENQVIINKKIDSRTEYNNLLFCCDRKMYSQGCKFSRFHFTFFD